MLGSVPGERDPEGVVYLLPVPMAIARTAVFLEVRLLSVIPRDWGWAALQGTGRPRSLPKWAGILRPEGRGS